VGQAIADPNNDLHRIVEANADDQKLVEEVFIRTLSRLPSAEEVLAFTSLRSEIGVNHKSLAESLREREAWWVEELPRREATRLETMKRAEVQLVAASEQAKPEQDRLATERMERIAAAQSKLDQLAPQSASRLAEWEKKQTDKTEWFPLVPVRMTSSNKDSLAAQEDRSIIVSGSAEKGVYDLTFNTLLRDITGIRIEALPMDLAKNRGPGLSENSNFVLTELSVSVSDRKTPKELTDVPLTGSLADFSQSSFDPAQVIDGKDKDQGGWAINGSNIHAHWLVCQTKAPLALNDEQSLRVRLSQFHNAEKHRLGRFRISVTTSKSEKIELGLAEPYQAALSVDADKRSEADKQLLTAYFDSIDTEVKASREALAAANAGVPADPEVVAAQARLERSKLPIAIDSQLERLRVDIAQSESQLKNERLTATEDLVWAIINSPGFLFNR